MTGPQKRLLIHLYANQNTQHVSTHDIRPAKALDNMNLIVFFDGSYTAQILAAGVLYVRENFPAEAATLLEGGDDGGILRLQHRQAAINLIVLELIIAFPGLTGGILGVEMLDLRIDAGAPLDIAPIGDAADNGLGRQKRDKRNRCF